jgi:hypothetical protein
MTVFDMQAFTKRTLVSKLKLVDSQRIMKLSQDENRSRDAIPRHACFLCIARDQNYRCITEFSTPRVPHKAKVKRLLTSFPTEVVLLSADPTRLPYNKATHLTPLPAYHVRDPTLYRFLLITASHKLHNRASDSARNTASCPVPSRVSRTRRGSIWVIPVRMKPIFHVSTYWKLFWRGED